MIYDRKVMKQDFNIIRIETSMDMAIEMNLITNTL